jgi:GMP synthase-like glutamine amidotransferase
VKKILVIQSRRRKEMIDAEQKEYEKALAGYATISFLSSLEPEHSWHEPKNILAGIDGLIIAGSGEFYLDGGRSPEDPAKTTAELIGERLAPLINYVIVHDFPTLGICFGHQLIGNARGGSVAHDHGQKKVGTHFLSLNKEGLQDKILGVLPERFNAQYGHQDSLTLLPSGATLLASGERCYFGALRYGTNVYTFQSHPELTKQDVLWKLANSPGYMPEGTDPETLVQESPEASRLIPRFAEAMG